MHNAAKGNYQIFRIVEPIIWIIDNLILFILFDFISVNKPF